MDKVPIQSLYGASYPRSRAVILMNLGSPDSPKVEDVAAYLTTFLMDKHVISIPRFWRSLLVKGIIAPRRAPRSAEAYRSIWDESSQSFPLISHTAQLARALSDKLEMPVAMAMRYGKPSMEDAVMALMALDRIKEVVIIPLYPHYTKSTILSAVEHAQTIIKRLGATFATSTIKPYYNNRRYRTALADSVRPYLQNPYDKLVISLHGIPTSHLDAPCARHNGKATHCLDRESQHTEQEQQTCYRLHCESTGAYLREDLGLPASKVEVVYQSRLGFHQWLKPYMKERVPQWAQEGCRRVVVISPGFACDCLETIYELNEEYHQEFLHSGGESFVYVPCLNSSPGFVEVLSDLVEQEYDQMFQNNNP